MKKTAEVKKDVVVIEINGVRTKISAKEYGKDSLNWKNWRVLDIERSERLRVNGQEVT